MSQGYTIHVTGLSPETTEAKLNDFFSFCGKLQSVTKTDKSATLVFEKESAMRTSLMLNGGTLDGAHLEVTSAQSATPASGALPTGASGKTAIGAGGIGSGPVGHGLEQEDKPVAGIVAEYLAHGYVLSDHIVQRAIEMDHKQGISSKFLNYISSLDHSVGHRVVGPDQTVSGKVNAHLQTAVQKTKEVDQSRGISTKATDYYAKALNTPIGQKVLSFYTTTSKQVIDVHEEAKRIAAEKKAAAGGTAPAAENTLNAASEKASSALPTTGATSTSTTGTTGTTVPAPAAPGPIE